MKYDFIKKKKKTSCYTARLPVAISFQLVLNKDKVA